jgi:putative RecB family exonuclease
MKLVVLAKEMLSLYFNLPPKKAKGAEVPFSVPLVDPSNSRFLPIDLEGVIDLIEEDDVITEFKTSAQMLDPKEVETNLQLTIYSYAYEVLYQKPPKLLKVINFVKSKKPKMNIYETRRGKADYLRCFGLASQVLKGINVRIFFPRTGFWCKDCEYGEYCRDWRGS